MDLNEAVCESVISSKLEFVAGDTKIITVSNKGILKGIVVGSSKLIVKYKNKEQEIMVNVFDEEELSENFVLDKARLKSKNVVFYGDSITAGQGLISGEKSYVNFLQQELGFKFKNFAVSGTTAALPNANGTSIGLNDNLTGIHFVNQNKASNAVADYAFIFYGTNDFNVAITKGDPESDDLYTTSGGINYMIDRLRKDNPKIRIILLTPTFRTLKPQFGGDTANDNGEVLTDFVEAIETIGQKKKVIVVNLYDLFDINNHYLYLPDGLHVNEDGYELIYKRIMGII